MSLLAADSFIPAAFTNIFAGNIALRKRHLTASSTPADFVDDATSRRTSRYRECIPRALARFSFACVSIAWRKKMHHSVHSSSLDSRGRHGLLDKHRGDENARIGDDPQETVVPCQRVRRSLDRLGQAPPIKVLGRELALVIINSHIPLLHLRRRLPPHHRADHAHGAVLRPEDHVLLLGVAVGREHQRAAPPVPAAHDRAVRLGLDHRD